MVAATRLSPFKVGDNQRPKRTMSGVRKPSPESSVPGENLTRGSRRNQLRRGHGSPPVLSEVPHELSTAAHSKECKRSPQQFIPAGFPLHNQLPTGTEDSAIPLTTPDMVRSGRVLQPQLNPHYFFSYFSLKNALIFLIFASYAVMIELTKYEPPSLEEKAMYVFIIFFTLIIFCYHRAFRYIINILRCKKQCQKIKAYNRYQDDCYYTYNFLSHKYVLLKLIINKLT